MSPKACRTSSSNMTQTLKASTALLKHVKEETKKLQELRSKQSLLPDKDEASDSDGELEDDQPVWLTLSTKQHIVDKARLKPSKIFVPHSSNTASSLSICIISADPQRAVKEVIAHPTFPTSVSTRINKIIGYSKLKARYHSFESRRQLLSEHDIFLADERILGRLPEALGKVFYKGTTKRPIPIRIADDTRVDGKRPNQGKPKPKKEDRHAAVGSPNLVAKEIEKALNSVPVNLKPGLSVSVRVGNISFTPQQLADNISAVANGVIEKHIVKGWRNVKRIDIKTPESAALPIWLADDMWVEDKKVMAPAEQKMIEEEKALEKSRKRKKKSQGGPQGHAQKKIKLEDVDEEKAKAGVRKARLAEQKARVLQQDVTAA